MSLEQWESNLVNVAIDIETKIKNSVSSLAEKNKTIKDIRKKFAEIYNGLKATDKIIESDNEKLSKLASKVQAAEKAGNKNIPETYTKLLNEQKRIAGNQSVLSNYVNKAIDKYGGYLIGSQDENLSDMGWTPIVIAGVTVAAIAAVTALIYGMYKVFLQHKGEVNKQNKMIDGFSKITDEVSQGKLTTDEAQLLLDRIPGSENTIAAQFSTVLPVIIVGGLIAAGLIFLNRTL
jgi:hypothetical protein